MRKRAWENWARALSAVEIIAFVLIQVSFCRSHNHPVSRLVIFMSFSCAIHWVDIGFLFKRLPLYHSSQVINNLSISVSYESYVFIIFKHRIMKSVNFNIFRFFNIFTNKYYGIYSSIFIFHKNYIPSLLFPSKFFMKLTILPE